MNRCIVLFSEREHKKQMSEERRDTATVHTKTAQAECIKGYKTQRNTAIMHHQWKLTVNSQNKVAKTQPRYRTQTSYIFKTVSLQPHRSSMPPLLLQHT